MLEKCPYVTFPCEIAPGDTLYALLAEQFGVSSQEILSANPSIDAWNLNVGHRIFIPIKKPAAIAHIKGGPLRPQIRGAVIFLCVPRGTWVCVEVEGLPDYQPGADGVDPIGPHGFHLHEFGSARLVTHKIHFNQQADTGIPPTSPMAIMQVIFLSCFHMGDTQGSAFSQVRSDPIKL